MKLLVLDNYESFSLVPYIQAAMPQHEVVKMGNIYTDHLWGIFINVNPDVVFVDFCDQNAVVLTERIKTLRHRPKIVIRLHGFEAQSWFPDKIDWGMVSDLIVVSPKFQEIMEQRLRNVPVKIHTIYNGIDLDKFQLQDAADNDDIAYVGYINKKKGPTLLRTVMASMPERKFHVGGVHQDEQVRLYMHDFNLKNVAYYGWVKTEEFLVGKRFVLSTSVTESFGMSIAEGMAMGLTTMVHDWAGAEKLWPQKCIWRTFDDLKAIQPEDPAWCREWVENRYSMKRCIGSVCALLFGNGNVGGEQLAKGSE